MYLYAFLNDEFFDTKSANMLRCQEINVNAVEICKRLQWNEHIEEASCQYGFTYIHKYINKYTFTEIYVRISYFMSKKQSTGKSCRKIKKCKYEYKPQRVMLKQLKLIGCQYLCWDIKFKYIFLLFQFHIGTTKYNWVKIYFKL